MLGTLEHKIEEYIDKTPFMAKLFFSYELHDLKESLEESKRLRAAYMPTEEWYVNYGTALNKGFNAVFNAVDRAYATYDAIKQLPLIGKPICNMAENYFNEFVYDALPTAFMSDMTGESLPAKIHIPQKQTALNAVQSMHSFAIEGLCAHYEATTNKSAENIRVQIALPLTSYERDPSSLRGTFISVIEGIGSLFQEMFGGSFAYNPNYS